MKIVIPTSLHSYTGGRHAEVRGGTFRELLADLDRQYPGIRFRMIDEQERMRPHMRLFLNGRPVFDLATPVSADDDVAIVQALSGG